MSNNEPVTKTNSNKQEFIDMVERMIDCYSAQWPDINLQTKWPGGWSFFQEMKKFEPKLTENGIKIITCMKDMIAYETSKYVAEQLGLSSRTVSASLIKLVNDGYVLKHTADKGPATYKLSDLGKKISI